MKWIWWLLILGLAIWLARGTRVRIDVGVGRRSPAPPPAGPGFTGSPPPTPDARRPAAKAGSRTVVPCAYCGVHLPHDEAVSSPTGDELFCSEAHRIALNADRELQRDRPSGRNGASS